MNTPLQIVIYTWIIVSALFMLYGAITILAIRFKDDEPVPLRFVAIGILISTLIIPFVLPLYFLDNGEEFSQRFTRTYLDLKKTYNEIYKD